MKYLSLFSGIGAFEKALQNIGVPYDLVAYCEIDKRPSKAYSLIHGVSEDKNLWDITQVDETKLPTDIDLLTYGFPCTDISIAGYKKGFVDEDGEKTRSGLFYDAMRIIRHCKPKIAVAENVSHLTSNKMKPVFSVVLNSLQDAGYDNYWAVMKATDYGIPQIRPRVLIVSIRMDVDDGSFHFPKPIPLDKCTRDFLDDEVDESFYMNQEQIESFSRHEENHKGGVIDADGVCNTLLARDFKWPKAIPGDRWRRMTPKEYFRLMGFTDEDYQKVHDGGISKTATYKMAGNSIVVNVVEALFRQLYTTETESGEPYQMTIDQWLRAM